MPVLNRIGKIRKRNHALVTFDPAKILRAIKRGADSAGGFAPDYLPEINEKIWNGDVQVLTDSEFKIVRKMIELKEPLEQLVNNPHNFTSGKHFLPPEKIKI